MGIFNLGLWILGVMWCSGLLGIFGVWTVITDYILFLGLGFGSAMYIPYSNIYIPFFQTLFFELILYVLQTSAFFAAWINPFVPTVPTFAASLGQQMLKLSCKNATVGTNGLKFMRMGKEGWIKGINCDIP